MEFVWVDLQHQPAGADVWVSFEGSGVLQCYLMLSSQFSAFSRGDAVDCYQFDVAPPERAVQIPSEGSWHVVMRGTGVAEVRVSSQARIDANVLAILQPEKHQDPTPEPGVPHLTERPRAGQGNQVDWLAGLQRATTQAVLDKMAKIDAIQRQLDNAAANATMSGPGSAGFDAADASFNQLKGDLIAALNELGNIPDYSTINPRSVTVSPGGNFLFDHTANGISVQTYGQYQNGNGTFFDQATGTYYTFTNGKLTSTSTPDPGRVTPDDELLFNTITTLVGAPEAAALIKGGGQAVFQGLKALLSREGADWVSGITGKNVLAEALAAAERRAASAPATIASTAGRNAVGPGAWEPVKEYMSARAAAYQTQITGHPITEGYIVNTATGPVTFDGFNNGVLIEVKSYYEQFTKGDDWLWFFDTEKNFLRQARSQIAAADGAPLEWVFAQPKVAAMVQELITEAKLSGITFRVELPK
jgi:hypothetical protein